MSFKIGFNADTPVNTEFEMAEADKFAERIPKLSLVQVYFPERNTTLTYYNDSFDLKAGDIVYVEGKLEGIRGRVRSVSYNFRIKRSEYKRVIAVGDTEVCGRLYFANTHFVAFDKKVFPREKAVTRFKAPENDEDVYISGKDDVFFRLDDLNGMKISSDIADRGGEYYCKNRVRYICLDGTSGYAVVEGGSAYEVEFEYKNGEISGLVCSCFCSFNCKHEFAVMLQLRELLDIIEKQYGSVYEKSGYFSAVNKGTLFEYAVYGREKGSIVLM